MLRAGHSTTPGRPQSDRRVSETVQSVEGGRCGEAMFIAV